MTQVVRQQGFTLIEILVAITILMILLGGALAGFITFRDRRETEEIARQVQQLVVLAQQKASVKETPQDCLTNNFPLRGYRVRISSGTPQTATLTALCALESTVSTPLPSAQPGDGTYVTIETLSIPNRISVTPTNYIDFYTLEGGINASRTFTFTGTASFSFSISGTGTISNVQ